MTNDSVLRIWAQNNSNIPMRFWGRKPSDLTANGKYPGVVEQWVWDVQLGEVIKAAGFASAGRGLMLYGAPGLGKTTTAVVAALEVLRGVPADKRHEVFGYASTTSLLRARPIYYLTMTEYLRQRKASFGASADDLAEMNDVLDGYLGVSKDDALNVRVLILDDINKQYGSEYDGFSFDEILRTRYDRALPTILTTNVTENMWAAKYGTIMESFFNEAFIPVQVEGVDLRKYPGGGK